MRAAQTAAWKKLAAATWSCSDSIATAARPGQAFATIATADQPAAVSLAQFHTSTARWQQQSTQQAGSETRPVFSPAGRISGPYRVTRQSAFAVVEISGTQYKVTPDDVIYTEKLKKVDVNEKISLNRILLLGTQYQTVIGRPYVPQASVLACIEEQFQDAKVLIFKKRRRKNSRRLNGHRQELTCIRILEINGLEGATSDQQGQQDDLPMAA